MTSELMPVRPTEPELTPFEVIERVISTGDLSRMTPADRVAFYWRTCESLGLNPLTQPFSFLNLGGKIVMYAKKDATDQLRAINHVSVIRLERDRQDDLAMVTAYGRDRQGREDSAIGAVSIAGLRGEALANAWMKAETKSKRRMTLSLVGLGFLDESEVEGLGTPVDVDATTGEITDRPRPSLLDQVRAQASAIAGVAETEGAAETAPEPVGLTETAEPEEADDLPAEPFMAEPMTADESAAIPFVTEDEDELLALATESAETGLTVQELAGLARAAKLGKAAFAGAIGCPPAETGKRIEAMTDVERYRLAQSLGLAT